MKHVMITQLKNQEERVFDWLFYHHKVGIDTFLIYDDFSEDGTLLEIDRFKREYPANVQVYPTDAQGNYYSIEQSKNSESYGWDSALNQRILRSYNSGNEIVKKINPDAFCYFFDVDEYLATDSEVKITEIVEELFSSNYFQLKVFNFDVRHDYLLQKGLIHKNENYYRWDFDSVNSDRKWRNRCKCITICKETNNPDFVHLIIRNDEKTLEVRDYNKLRMLHFRIPNLPGGHNMKYILDNNIKEKFIKFS